MATTVNISIVNNETGTTVSGYGETTPETLALAKQLQQALADTATEPPVVTLPPAPDAPPPAPETSEQPADEMPSA